jgi:hypothetical protein
MSIPADRAQVLDFFGTPLVIEPSAEQPGDGPQSRLRYNQFING